LKGATLGLLLLVLGADMLGSPPLLDSTAPMAPAPSMEARPQTVAEAEQIYLKSLQPADWENRRAAAAYLIAHLNPPRQYRKEWEDIDRSLRNAPQPASAWDCALLLNNGQERARGLLGAYQNRLSGLRRQQLNEVAESLKPVLQANDYPGYRERLPVQGEISGPLGLMLDLRPMARVGREDLLPYPVWWGILANASNARALQAGLRLSQGKAPELPYRIEGADYACWTAGPDGKDEGGLVEASLQEVPESDPGGDWVYRFRR
jgi:hypothetical protein